MAKKRVKVGVRRGEGPPPGYEWSVLILDQAYEETIQFLTVDQYQHISISFRQLALELDPSHSKTASIDKIEDFFRVARQRRNSWKDQFAGLFRS